MSNFDNEPFSIASSGSFSGTVHAHEGNVPVEPVLLDLSSRAAKFDTLKRIFDILISLVVLISVALPALVIGMMLKIQSSGSILSKQTMMGKNATPFTMYTFRTTIHGTTLGWGLTDETAGLGPFLATTGLKIIPRFFNVLRGDMSLVGPRPIEASAHQMLNNQIPGFAERLAVRPGLTGLAHVNGGLTLLPEEELAHDHTYISTDAFRIDARLIAMTLTQAFTS